MVRNPPKVTSRVAGSDWKMSRVSAQRSGAPKLRPMAKTVLLLFLQHPEGIPLKCIGDHREELAVYYRRCSRSLDPAAIDRSISRILDIFSNDLNVNIARVNAAVDMLAGKASLYRIQGAPGHAKTILLDRSLVVWE